MQYLKQFCWLCLLTFMVACDADDSAEQQVILGRWEIQKATRNSRATESLADLYFDFSEDGSMQTNLTGEVENGKFSIKDKRLFQSETTPAINYTIESLTDSQLVLSTSLRSYDFKFFLGRPIEEE